MNGWVNNSQAGDLRRQQVHYDVTVMCDNHEKLIQTHLDESSSKRLVLDSFEYLDIYVMCS